MLTFWKRAGGVVLSVAGAYYVLPAAQKRDLLEFGGCLFAILAGVWLAGRNDR